MSSPTANNRANLTNDIADRVLIETSTVMTTLYVMFNMCGFIRVSDQKVLKGT